jgi:hypothetical protein
VAGAYARRLVTATLHPTAGVRVLLERQGEASADSARYQGTIFTPEARFDFAIVIAADGAVAMTAAPGPASADARAVELLRSIARTIGRHALAERPPAWPRRVLRWRSLR